MCPFTHTLFLSLPPGSERVASRHTYCCIQGCYCVKSKCVPFPLECQPAQCDVIVGQMNAFPPLHLFSLDTLSRKVNLTILQSADHYILPPYWVNNTYNRCSRPEGAKGLFEVGRQHGTVLCVDGVAAPGLSIKTDLVSTVLHVDVWLWVWLNPFQSWWNVQDQSPRL